MRFKEFLIRRTCREQSQRRVGITRRKEAELFLRRKCKMLEKEVRKFKPSWNFASKRQIMQTNKEEKKV